MESANVSATNRAIATYELLEMILLAVPTKDVLLAQRVSAPFRRTIASSAALRRRLHLQPEPIASLSTLRLHPRFIQLFDAIGLRRSSVYGEMDMAAARSTLGSWRDMFPSQPPPTAIVITQLPYNIWPSQKRPVLKYRRPDVYLTLGMIMDAIWPLTEERHWKDGAKAKFYALRDEDLVPLTSQYKCEVIEIVDEDRTGE